MDYKQEALNEAQKSKCKKRKVGAIIVSNGSIIGRGHNYNPEDINHGCCEDNNGNTFSYVIHAEIAAIEDAQLSTFDRDNTTMYVTHQPCDNCKKALDTAGILDIVIVKDDKMDYNPSNGEGSDVDNTTSS